MSVLVEDHEKATQAVNFFADLEGGRIQKIKAIKLIWLADRYHIRRYGRPITNDKYLAMKLGPVGSTAKDVAESSTFMPSEEKEYAIKFIEPISKNDLRSKRKPDLSVFSQSDVEALRKVYKHFGKLKGFTLAKRSHDYPEWKKHEDAIEKGVRYIDMDYFDFFKNNKADHKDDFFQESSAMLAAAKFVFEDNLKLEQAWA